MIKLGSLGHFNDKNALQKIHNFRERYHGVLVIVKNNFLQAMVQ